MVARPKEIFNTSILSYKFMFKQPSILVHCSISQTLDQIGHDPSHFLFHSEMVRYLLFITATIENPASQRYDVIERNILI